MNILRNILHYFVLLSVSFTYIYAQDENVYEDMSLEEISNIDVVVSASKRPEDIFETPLSVTIIKREEIRNSGANSIPEALRLSPGLIVREVTPGNYDIHIRGFDDITRSYIYPLPTNTILLVMIDNRESYSYYTGGTFWESLPIDINDVERIEVVRGPASALYGPNAVSGVINIITNHSTEDGFNAYFKATRGQNNSGIINVNLGYNFDEKLKTSFSANMTTFSRYDDKYYNWNGNSYIPNDSLQFYSNLVADSTIKNELGKIDDLSQSLNRFGMNFFATYNHSEDFKIDYKFGAFGAEAQKVYINNFTAPLSVINNFGVYSDFKIKFWDFTLQSFGEAGDYKTNYYYNNHKYENWNMNLDYYFKIDNLSFRPQIGVTSANCSSPILGGVILGEPAETAANSKDKEIRTFNTSLFTEWQPLSQLRFIGGVRGDFYEFNKTGALSYELAMTYRYDKSHLFRAVTARSNRSPFMIDTYFDAVGISYISQRIPGRDTSFYVPIISNYKGNQELDFITQTSYEIGWRYKPTYKLSFDFTLFYSTISNLTVMDQEHTVYFNEITKRVDSIVNDIQFINSKDISASQYGLTISSSYNYKDLDIKLFGTLQKTDLTIKNEEFASKDFIRFENKSTPDLTCGATANYKLWEDLNLNLNYYMMTSSEFSSVPTESVNNDSKIQKQHYTHSINTFNILNASIMYNISGRIWLSFTAKNLLGKHYEYGFVDKIGSNYFFTFEFK